MIINLRTFFSTTFNALCCFRTGILWGMLPSWTGRNNRHNQVFSYKESGDPGKWILGLICFLGLVLAAQASGPMVVTLAFESQLLDLDTGTVIDSADSDPTAGTDVLCAYNANRPVHAVVMSPTGQPVELAFLQGTPFDSVTSESVSGVNFSSQPVDLPFTASDTVIVRTDSGALFKLGNASEGVGSVTFNYSQMQ